MDWQGTELFRRIAKEQGIILDYGAKGAKFFFDLNQGKIETSPDPEKVFQLVKIARQCARSDSYGEHNALLSLVAERSELDKDLVFWHRSYYVDASKYPERWISLNDWLKNRGFDFSTISAEKSP